VRIDGAPSLTLAVETVTTEDLSLRIQVAAAAGFDGLGVRPEDYFAAREQGRSDRELRALLSDNDVICRELHCVRGWAGSPAARAQARLEEEGCYLVADAIGGDYLVLASTELDGDLDAAAEAAAAIAARSAEHGLRVALEFMPWLTIADARQAWDVVCRAGAPNLGVMVDSWHHFRGAANDEYLRDIGKGGIVAVQIDDARAEIRGALPDDTRNERLLPGEGDFDLVHFVRLLDDLGVHLPFSVEVLSHIQRTRPPGVAARLAARSTREVLARARAGYGRASL
jgi:sugar phosphate isomerase/epimerase